jgi:hypothetical protein
MEHLNFYQNNLFAFNDNEAIYKTMDGTFVKMKKLAKCDTSKWWSETGWKNPIENEWLYDTNKDNNLLCCHITFEEVKQWVVENKENLQCDPTKLEYKEMVEIFIKEL